MPFTLVHGAGCPSCGRTHTFSVAGELVEAQRYNYVCPRTGSLASVRPEGTREIARHTPQGAVALGDVKPSRVAA